MVEHPPLPAADASGVGTTKKGVETRRRIIRGAREALENEGIEALTTRKIAASANVRLATLHYYFSSKETLLLAVLEDMIDDMAVNYESVALGDDPEERIDTLLRLVWFYIGNTRNRQIAQFELTLYALRTKGVGWLAERQYGAYIDFYSRLVFNDGTLPEEERILMARKLARFILTGIDGLILQTFSLHDDEIARENVEALIFATQAYSRKLRGN